jgi:hypothetical protein
MRRKQKKARSIREPVDQLMKTAKSFRREAVEAWAPQARAIAEEVVPDAKEVLEEKSTN